MAEDPERSVREVTYPSWLPTFEQQRGKVVCKADVPGYPLDQITGNPYDQGTDWAMLGPWINGATEFSAGVFTMAPNQTHPPHYHPIGPEFYYIVAGSCLIRVDDEQHEVGPETALYFPEGTVHAVWTRADESVTIVYAFALRGDPGVTTVWLE